MSLETYTPIPRTCTVNGETVQVYPLKVRQFAEFSKYAKTLFQVFDGSDWFTIIEEHLGDVVKALSIATDKPQTLFDEATILELIEAIAVVVEVNTDFFNHLPGITQRILGRLTHGGISSQPSEIAGSPIASA